jgi:hypothetical protein
LERIEERTAALNALARLGKALVRPDVTRQKRTVFACVLTRAYSAI